MDPETRIRSSGCSPEVIEKLIATFNKVWDEIGHNFPSERAGDDARDRLARIILAYSSDTALDAAGLKATAHLVMVMNYPGISRRNEDEV